MGPSKKNTGKTCCRIEAVVSVDDRGQILLPRDLREKAGLKPGDKLAVITAEDGGEVCCIQMIKADKLAALVRDFLGPVLANLI